MLANIAMLPGLARHLSRAALVTDVGSTKRLITAAAGAVPRLAFIGGHPMAGGGARRRGERAGGPVPGPALDPDAGRGYRTGAGCGSKRSWPALGGVPHIMTPELHDRFVGAVSHLPQLTASALMHVVGTLAGDAGLEIAGAGLYDTTRLAASPAGIWKDVAATNHDVLRPAIDALIATLAEMRDSLETGEGIEAVFTSACRWREELDRSRGE